MTDLVPYARPTALELPDDLPFEEWLAIGGQLLRATEGVMWWIGDWWAYGDHHYGERARMASEAFGRAFQTCVNAGNVARKFGTNRRRLVLSWSFHAEVAALDAPEADEILDKAEGNGWSQKDLRAEVRRRALARRLGLAARQAPELAALGRYQVIYADPPWQYEDAEPSRAIENNYLPMALEDIAALDVPAADDAVLFLWASSPKLAEALEIVEAWDFHYRTHMVWAKDQIGMGYYARQQHEDLLIAKRGNLPVPEPQNRPTSVVLAPRGEHSVKPERFYELIEAMYPGLAKVELFARTARPGWAAWGDQVAL